MHKDKVLQDFYVRDMVCPRCVTSVRTIFERSGYLVRQIELGYVSAVPPGDALAPTPDLVEALHTVGFTLNLGNEGLLGHLRGLIIDYVYCPVADRPENLSDYLAAKLDMSYSHLSHLFSASEGRTIEDFFRAHRLERAKRLLANSNELVSQIGYRLGYGTAAYFSTDFKRAIGCSPGAFRKQGAYRGMDITKL